MERVRKIINASYAHRRGYYGEGVGVAVMDTGIFPHPDFEHRIAGFQDYIGYQKRMYDDNGHGTHVACLKHDNDYFIRKWLSKQTVRKWSSFTIE